jgi:hypothetical protein
MWQAATLFRASLSSDDDAPVPPGPFFHESGRHRSNNWFIINQDGLVKSRHTRKSGYPESSQPSEKTGFPFSRE